MTEPAAGQEAPTAPAEAPPATGTPGQADPWSGFAWDGNVDSLPEPIAKVIRDARADAGKARTSAKQTAAEEARQELAQQIGKALGLVKDDSEKPDPAKLTEQITAERAGRHEALVKLALYETAKDHGGNPAALKDSVSFLAKVAKLDPTAQDFAAQVSAAAKEAVAANPNYREAGQAPLRSGGEFTGGPGAARDEPASPVDRMARAYANQP